MNKFQAGDKVKCVDAQNYGEGYLVNGKVYTVTGLDFGGDPFVDGIGLSLSGRTAYGWSEKRFELVEPASKTTESPKHEFKEGDYAEVTNENVSCFKRGDKILLGTKDTDGSFRGKRESDDKEQWLWPEYLKPIEPQDHPVNLPQGYQEDQFVILELCSMKEILEANPEAYFDVGGALWRSEKEFNDDLNDFDHVYPEDFHKLGDTIKANNPDQIPSWAIRRNLGR